MKWKFKKGKLYGKGDFYIKWNTKRKRYDIKKFGFYYGSTRKLKAAKVMLMESYNNSGQWRD